MDKRMDSRLYMVFEAVNRIEGDMPEQDARAFIQNYIRTSLPAGWRFLT